MHNDEVVQEKGPYHLPSPIVPLKKKVYGHLPPVPTTETSLLSVETKYLRNYSSGTGSQVSPVFFFPICPVPLEPIDFELPVKNFVPEVPLRDFIYSVTSLSRRYTPPLLVDPSFADP